MGLCSAFTAVVCAAPACGLADEGSNAARTLATVRAAVRASRHGVLVTTGCLLVAAACALRPSAPVVLVQPCDERRSPTGPAIRVGPLRTAADADALGVWLHRGDLDPGGLPAHLLDLHRRVAAAPLN